MRVLSFLVLSFTLLVTSGCASLSKEECLSGNWKQIGYNDGARGGDASNNLRSHSKSCAEHGVSINNDAYYAGHKEGLKKFCLPANGRRHGEQGLHYSGACPAELESAFLLQYTYGKKIHDAIQEYNQTKRDIYDKEKALEKEADSRIRDALRSEITTLDKLLRNQQRNIDRLNDNAPPY